jgi:transcriptional regulator of acetoin/glycerol metabolism
MQENALESQETKPVLKTLAQLEAEAIKETIDYFNGNLSKASKSLGIGRATIYRKIKQYGLNI